jgi:suppressor of fused
MALGRDAIDAALDQLYPNQKALRFAGPPRADGQPPSVIELAVQRSGEERPHWHYVTYGLSELFQKQTANPAISGYGLELTFRIVRGDEGAPPPWPMRVLAYLADYVFDSGNVFDALHVIRITGLPMQQIGTAVASVLFAADPRVRPVDTVNGRVCFVQAFGITLEEEELIACWDAEQFLAAAAIFSPLLITDPKRETLITQALLERARTEGSQREVEFVPELALEHTPGMNRAVTLSLDRTLGTVLARLLRFRLAYRRSAKLSAPGITLVLVPAMPGYPAWTADTGSEVTIGVPPERIEALSHACEGEIGTYRWPWFEELTIVRI